MKNKILTVKVAACNVSKYLDECLDVFADKKLEEMLEVLIVVNESIDNSLDIALSYQNKYPEIFKVISNGKNNYASTYNVGFNLATGKYWTSLDGDDSIEKDKLFEYLMFLKECNSDMIVSEWMQFDGEGKQKLKHYYDGFTENEYQFAEIAKTIKFVEIFAFTIKTCIIQENKIQIDEQSPFASDVKTVAYCMPYVETVAFFHKDLKKYRRHSAQATSNIKTLMRSQKSFEDSAIKILDFIDGLSSEAVRTYLMRRVYSMVALPYRNFLLLPYNNENVKELRKYNEQIKNHRVKINNNILNDFIAFCPKTMHYLLGPIYKIYKKLSKWLVV
ncbi:MAG: glycosyltransferase [Lachnobacterium sp.]|nr:glycosyltransferase [Lachnobacterium sp.]